MTLLSRRKLLALGATTATARALPWDAFAESFAEVEAYVRGPAVKPLPVQKVSRHVYVIKSPDGFPTPQNQGMMCNVTFVVGKKGVVVVDSGASVQIGEMAIRQLKTVTDKPVVGIVNTHYHGDHWLGNHAFVEAFGKDLPRYAMAETRAAIEGMQGNFWNASMVKWTAGASAGTEIVPPNVDAKHGDEFDLGDVTLRLHHYGKAHTPSDISVEVVGDGVMCVGDVMMDRRIANMDDGSYPGTFACMDQLVANSKTAIWLPGHGTPGPGVITWQRDLFAGIWEACQKAVQAGISMEETATLAMKDPRVSSRATETKGWERNFGKYVSLAYLEAEQAGF